MTINGSTHHHSAESERLSIGVAFEWAEKFCDFIDYSGGQSALLRNALDGFLSPHQIVHTCTIIDKEESELRRFHDFSTLAMLGRLAVYLSQAGKKRKAKQLTHDFKSIFSDEGIFLFKSMDDNQARHIFFEYLMGMQLLLSHDNTFKRNDPDLIIETEMGNVGVACKALISEKHAAWNCALEKAASQIEKSSCRFGIIAVDFSPCLIRFFRESALSPEGTDIIDDVFNKHVNMPYLKNNTHSRHVAGKGSCGKTRGFLFYISATFFHASTILTPSMLYFDRQAFCPSEDALKNTVTERNRAEDLFYDFRDGTASFLKDQMRMP